MVDWTRKLLDGLLADAPKNVPGTRPIHSTGIGAVGRFRPSHAAAQFAKAEHFAPVRSIPVTMRFSNGSGSQVPDGAPQVRGLAVKFHLGAITVDEHGVLHGERETDMIGMSIPMFVANTVEATLEFSKAYVPRRVPKVGLILRAKSLVSLCPLPPMPPAGTMSGDPGVLAFAQTYKPGQAAAFANSLLRPPASYARTSFFGVHAFDLEDPDGNHRMVRFVFEPAEGLHDEARTDLAPDYLRTELGTRLERGPGRFVLRMQIGDQWDDPTDCTTVWPLNRPRVVMGVLIVDRLVADQEWGCEKMSYNPGRFVDGIGPSDDPILFARIAAYNESQRIRGAARCPVHVPEARVTGSLTT